MKLAVTALTTIFLGMASAFAAEPAKVATIGDAKVYTDANGMTLYTFDRDEAGKSNCDAGCLAKWPAFKAEAGAAAEGDWTVVEASDGSMMWAHKGKPLYTYVDDKSAGDATGDGAGGVWHLATAE
jgi:predicted lipoprotein with Yx(FWY)xxD motif